MPTQEHRPINLVELPKNMSLPGLQAMHAHMKYTAGVWLCLGIGFHPKSQIGAVYILVKAPARVHYRI